MGKLAKSREVPKGWRESETGLLLPPNFVKPKDVDALGCVLSDLKSRVDALGEPGFLRLSDGRQERVLDSLLGEKLLSYVGADCDKLIDVAGKTGGGVRLGLTKLVLELGRRGGIHETDHSLLESRSGGIGLSGRQLGRLLDYNMDNPDSPVVTELVDTGLKNLQSLTPNGMRHMMELVSKQPWSPQQERVSDLPEDYTFGLELELDVGCMGDGRFVRNTVSTSTLLKQLKDRCGEQMPDFIVKRDEGNVEVTTPFGGLKNTSGDWNRFNDFVSLLCDETNPHTIRSGPHLRSGLPVDSPDSMKALTYIGKAFEYWLQILSPSPSLSKVKFPQSALYGDEATYKNETLLYHNSKGGKPTIAFNAFEMPPMKEKDTARRVHALISFCMHACHAASTHPQDFTLTSGWLPVFEGGAGTTESQRLMVLGRALDLIYGEDTEGKKDFLKLVDDAEKKGRATKNPSESTETLRQTLGWKNTDSAEPQPVTTLDLVDMVNANPYNDSLQRGGVYALASMGLSQSQASEHTPQALVEVIKANPQDIYLQRACVDALGAIGLSQSPASEHTPQALVNLINTNQSNLDIQRLGVRHIGVIGSSQSPASEHTPQALLDVINANPQNPHIQIACVNALGDIGLSQSPASEHTPQALVDVINVNPPNPDLQSWGLYELDRIGSSESPASENARRLSAELKR